MNNYAYLLSRTRIRLIFIAGLFVALTMWSWRKWADLIIDFGREPYTAWQIVCGKVLYRDIASLFGPLSPYANALWFYLFDISLTTIIIANLCILAVITTMIYYLFRCACDCATATVLVCVFLCLFAFGQYQVIANFNFVCPYTHAATHGTALVIAMIFFFHRYLINLRITNCALAGLCLGAVMMTKQEIGVAAVATAFSALVAILLLHKFSWRAGVAFITMAMVPFLFFLGLFSQYMSIPKALHSVCYPWLALLSSQNVNLFYLQVAGFDDVLGSGLQILRLFGWFSVWLLSLTVLDRYTCKIGDSVRIRIAILLFISLSLFGYYFFIYTMACILPLTSLVISLSAIYQFIRQRRNLQQAHCLFPLTLWAILSLTMLLKIVLNAKINHYGFYLAMPATLLLTSVLLHHIPRFLYARYNGGKIFFSVAIITITAMLAINLKISHSFYRHKNLAVGKNGDVLMTPRPIKHAGTITKVQYPEGIAIKQLLAVIEQYVDPQATMVVFPEGLMINYWTRRANPIRYILFNPLDIQRHGEDNMIRRLDEKKPDIVILMHRDASEYGMGYFGSNLNGKKIMDWVNVHYKAVMVILHEPLKNKLFGIKIFQIKRTKKS